MTELIGSVLTHYKIESMLGKGGMGVVYLARDTRLERPVALKLLPPQFVSDPDRRTRFLLEARSAAAVTHPAIAQIYEIDEAAGTVFIAMEYVAGKTVSRLIADRELDLMGAVEIALQVAEGLGRAHEAGIIHRDIKSDNIMVTPEGHAKILDFGLAKLRESAGKEPETPAGAERTWTKNRTNTLPGTVMGTISYMSPEQARGQAMDARSDIFSLGVVIYEMVTGELPFKGDSPIDTMHAIAYEEAQPVTIVRKNLSPDVHRIIQRCLRKRPEDRYPDARVLAADLKRLKQDLESGTRRSLPSGMRLREWMERLKTTIPLGTAGLIGLAAAVILMVALLIKGINGGGFLGPVIIGFFVYRAFRNKKRRMLKKFVQKMSKLPGVRVVVIREDKVTVVVDHAQASLYLRVGSLIDEINKKLYFGKHVEAEVRDEVSDEEYRNLLRQTGVAYVRDDAGLGASAQSMTGPK